MSKKIKTFSIVLLILGIVMLVTGVSMAFFNYARVGGTNTLAVGRVYFTSSQGNAINLTNVFPVKSTEIENNLNVGSVTINVQGDTTYDEGIEYLISAVDVSNTINNKAVPIGISVTATNLGTSDNDYYTNRGGNTSIYKVLAEAPIYEDSHIAVGYITKGVTGINGSITVKAYIDADRIAVSDTYDGTESDSMNTKNSWVNGRVVLTETEWNSLITGGVSFKIKVEANEDIWVMEHILFQQVIASNTSQSYIASYDDIIASNPTFTTQDTVSVNNNKQTVYYYTGNTAGANANVLFAGFCWQIVRTTDTGGIKLVYNGVAENNKCQTTRSDKKGVTAVGNSSSAQTMTSASLFGRSYDYNLTTGEFTIEDTTGLPSSWTTNDNNSNGIADYKELLGTYTCLSSSNTCTSLYYVGKINDLNANQARVVNYTINDVSYSYVGISAVNSFKSSPADVGYMFNDVYNYNSGSKSGEYFATVTWNGTTYQLSSGNSGTAPDATHHYICDTNCSKIRYYYYVSGSNYYYILLENGKTVENALSEMLNWKINSTNPDENINVYDSSIKGYLENWYEQEMVSYADYLDNNMVFCNDRSITELGGWNSNGTSLTENLKFYQYNGNSNLNCTNVTDRFSVANIKAELKYPVGLLTKPEIILMTPNYAKKSGFYWTGSPTFYNEYSSQSCIVNSQGGCENYAVNGNIYVRPVITLKPGTLLSSGTGTYNDPYIVGPIVSRTN